MNMPVPFLPLAALTDDQQSRLEALANSLNREQMLWASGYLAGLAQAHAAARVSSAQSPIPAAATPASPLTESLTILYGSETGNAAELARLVEARARGMGMKAQAHDLAAYKTRGLKDERNILVITSTHGEGDPPEPAAGFFEFINSRKAPSLKDARFAVLGLGDSTYEFFCEAAKLLDTRFAELGATRLYTRLDCDVDYEKRAGEWVDAVLHLLKPAKAADELRLFSSHPAEGSAARPAAIPPKAAASRAAASYDKRNPFSATMIENISLTGRGSSKDTRHIEFSIADSNLVYEPGDALGIAARNDPALVEEILMLGGWSGDTPFPTAEGDTLQEALTGRFEITALTPNFIRHWAEWSSADDLKTLTAEGNRSALNAFMRGHHVCDLMRLYPVGDLEPASFASALRGLQPRLYSISSSQLMAPDEVHIMVAAVRYQLHGTQRFGVASCHLADRMRADDQVPVYIQRNEHFRPPQDRQAPIIMVGAGTGVAPFRAFAQQREAEGPQGKAWLFFGERNFRTDFLYQTEWQAWLKDGTLDRMDVAFSRDQAEKRYIQHVMRERGAELFSWLQDGAHIYLCGDAGTLAPDVQEALLSIAETHGLMTREDAGEYLRTLQQEGRYQRDVY